MLTGRSRTLLGQPVSENDHTYAKLEDAPAQEEVKQTIHVEHIVMDNIMDEVSLDADRKATGAGSQGLQSGPSGPVVGKNPIPVPLDAFKQPPLDDNVNTTKEDQDIKNQDTFNKNANQDVGSDEPVTNNRIALDPEVVVLNEKNAGILGKRHWQDIEQLDDTVEDITAKRHRDL